MLTIIVYVLVTLIVATALFTLSVVVFGRGEVLPAVAKDHTITHLPAGPLNGDDLRAVRFSMSARGYTMAEVDWTLEQAATEIEQLRARLGGPGGDGSTSAELGGPAATTSPERRTR